MTQEELAQHIFLTFVGRINLNAGVGVMNAEAEAAVKRSRNLAKLWFDSVPIPQEEAEAAYTAELQEVSNEVAQNAARRGGRPRRSA